MEEETKLRLRGHLSRTAQTISVVSQRSAKRSPNLIAVTVSSFHCISIPKAQHSPPIGAISVIGNSNFREHLDLGLELQVYVLSSKQSDLARFFSTSGIHEKYSQLQIENEVVRAKEGCLFEFYGLNLKEYLLGESSLISFEMGGFLGQDNGFPLIYQNRKYLDHLSS